MNIGKRVDFQMIEKIIKEENTFIADLFSITPIPVHNQNEGRLNDKNTTSTWVHSFLLFQIMLYLK